MSTIYEDMQAVAIRVLEDWGMMLVEPVEDWRRAFDQAKPCFVGKLEFRGLVSGTYSVVCQEKFVSNLTANLLGEDNTEVSEAAQYRDALSEMVNVLSGNLLTSCYGEDAVFDLSSPQVIEIAFGEVASVVEGYSLSYMADDQPVVITFTPKRVTAHGN